MAWPVPILEADWPSFPWQPLAFWQAMVGGTNLRLQAQYELISYGTARALDADPELNKVSKFTALREDALTQLDEGAWIDPATKPVAGEVYNPIRYTDATGWTQAMVDAVNAVLDGWGVPKMGLTLLAGGKLPWTRKHGDQDALATSYGPYADGDVEGVWLFNEWRASLEVLKAIEHPGVGSGDLTWDPGAGDAVWAGGSAGLDTTCADAKDACEADYSFSYTGASLLGVRGRIQYGTFFDPLAFSAVYDRENQDAQITWVPVTHGTLHAYAIAVRGVGDFYAYGDPYEEGKVGHVQTSASATFAFNAPFRDSATAAADIQVVTCPTVPGDAVEWGFYLPEIKGVVVLAYPDP